MAKSKGSGGRGGGATSRGTGGSSIGSLAQGVVSTRGRDRSRIVRSAINGGQGQRLVQELRDRGFGGLADKVSRYISSGGVESLG